MCYSRQCRNRKTTDYPHQRTWPPALKHLSKFLATLSLLSVRQKAFAVDISCQVWGSCCRFADRAGSSVGLHSRVDLRCRSLKGSAHLTHGQYEAAQHHKPKPCQTKRSVNCMLGLLLDASTAKNSSRTLKHTRDGSSTDFWAAARAASKSMNQRCLPNSSTETAWHIVTYLPCNAITSYHSSASRPPPKVLYLRSRIYPQARESG